MSLDLDFDDSQRAIADAVAHFCRDECDAVVVRAVAGTFPAGLWKGLAELGVLGLATPEGEGGAAELVAAVEALGRAAFPGPLSATFFATQLLPRESRTAVASGQAVVSVGAPPLMPWAPVAAVFIEIDGERAFLAAPRGPMEAVETLGGEPWGRVALERERDLGPTTSARALSEIARAAYLAAAGRRLVEDAAEHARTRRQFGRAIGEFQAVAHPLADCAMRLAAAATLARAAACHFDRAATDAPARAAAARLSAARASLEAVHVAHQVFGAIGIALEGPAFHISRRVRQLASLVPDEAGARECVLDHFGL